MRPCFVEFQRSKYANIVGAEIGVHRGIHAMDIVQNLPNLKKLYLVDPYVIGGAFDGDRKKEKEEARTKLNEFADKRQWLYETSEDASRTFDDNYFDFVYIDGDHSYDAVLLDLRLWWSKIKHNGMIAGHDFDIKHHPGVHRAVLDFVNGTNCTLNIHCYFPRPHKKQSTSSDWWIFKDSEA